MVIAWLVFRVKSETMGKILQMSIKGYEKQISILEQDHEKELKERDKNLAKYHETLTEIESKYEEENKKLSSSKKKVLKKIVEKHHNDVDGLAKEISEKFGVTYVPTNND
tara:strand:- start:370 stop:699 length:330 start_codon:yes stop_codon:yes gene_type:complete